MAFYFEVAFTDNNDSPIETFRPVDLKWSYKMKEPGDVYLELALSDPLLTADIIAPFSSNWQINMRIGDSGSPAASWDSQPLAAGITTSVNVESNTGILKVSGLDWLHWLEQPYRGFDYYNNDVTSLLSSNADGDFNQYWTSQFQETVVYGIFSTLNGGTNQLVFDSVFNGSAWGQTIDYSISHGDSTTVLEHLQAIAAMYDPRGFDFWMTWDKMLTMTGPRAIDPTAVTPIATFTLAVGNSVVAYDWTNNGPAAVTTTGIGSGSGNLRKFFTNTYDPSADLYRDWFQIVNFQSPAAGLSGSDVIEGLASAQGFLDRFPQKDLKLTIKPDTANPSDETTFFTQLLGEAVNVNYAFPGSYHTISADFYIVGQDFASDGHGNWTCDLQLEQIYT